MARQHVWCGPDLILCDTISDMSSMASERSFRDEQMLCHRTLAEICVTPVEVAS